jgi:arsenite methyltransferase
MAERMREKVQKKYAELAVASQAGGDASCCGTSCGCGTPAQETADRVSDM